MRTHYIAQGEKKVQSVCRTYINFKSAFQYTLVQILFDSSYVSFLQ